MSKDEGKEFHTPTVDETIEKLIKNSYQYASAGDVKRLITEINRLRGFPASFTANPVQGPINYEEMADDIMKRFSKTMGYLAKN